MTKAENTGASDVITRIEVRPGAFELSDDISAHWIPNRPELAQMINGASMVMPYLEPFLIASIREALQHISDKDLREDGRAFIGQEGQHYRTHRRFNETIKAQGYGAIAEIEVKMEASYAALSKYSLGFRLAYTAGFESMTLGITKWLIDDRRSLLGGADPRIASFVLWHMVEETEHKKVAFDIYQAVTPGYWRRAWGVICGASHVVWLTRENYKVLLQKDGLWGNLTSRIEGWKIALNFLSHALPFLFRAMLPGHDPRQEPDPGWASDWIAGYRHQRRQGLESAAMPLVDTLSMDLAPPFGAHWSAEVTK
jgi:predicted metal-dependent hydrolase